MVIIASNIAVGPPKLATATFHFKSLRDPFRPPSSLLSLQIENSDSYLRDSRKQNSTFQALHLHFVHQPIAKGNWGLGNSSRMNDLMTKSFTNYVDLKKEAMKDLEAGNADLEMTEKQIDPKLALFLEEAEKVKEEMGEIRVLLGRLEEANEQGKSLHKPEALKALRNGINMDITTVLKKARTIKTQIEKMNADNNSKNTNTPIDRARMSVTNGLQKKLKELMMDFQGLRQKMMAEHREMVGRRYFTVTGENPDEEVIEKIISNGESGGEDFLHKAIQEHGRGKVLETVVEIQDRHSAAIEIEKSLLELHQVFLDMAVMVEAQGEQLDDIHHHVMHAAHYVKDGHTELKTAKGHQRSSRRCMCLGMILLLILILVVVIPIATSFHDS